MANETKMEDMIRASLESIRSLIDANTIIGEPIKTDSGVTLIPVSKVMVGYASGGVDFNGKKDSGNQQKNFGGGGGTGLTVSPVAFLAVDREGNVNVVNLGEKAPTDFAGQAASVIERAPEIISKIKAFFKKRKGAEEEEAPEAPDLDAENSESI